MHRPGRQHQIRQTKTTGTINGVVASIMALDRAIRGVDKWAVVCMAGEG